MRNSPKERSKPAGAPKANGYINSLDFLQASMAGVQANIFVADTQFTILYANPKALETLRLLADEIRKAFAVEVDDIVGASIHRFHKDKRRVERILRNPAALPGYSRRRSACSPDSSH